MKQKHQDNKIYKLCILCACVVSLSAQDPTTGSSQTASDTTVGFVGSNHPRVVTNNETEVDKVTAVVKLNKETDKPNESVDAVGNKLDANRTVEGVDADGVLNTTFNDAAAQKEYKKTANGTADALDINGVVNATVPKDIVAETGTKSVNETFVERIEQVMKRLFKREIVGSLVMRDTEEMRENQKITVPMFFQSEYFKLKLRKQEIDRNKDLFRNSKNVSEYGDLVQETWEKLVNWSQDHIRFEKKIIEIHKLKTHDHIQRKCS